MEIEVDAFAGGGGATTGIETATGKPVAVAINHDPDAIAMHKLNHPRTRHYLEDVWKVDPDRATRGRPVGLFFCSPDCKHHSRARGSKPVDQKVRSLAWVAVRWAKRERPRLIVLENVREFQSWGPILPRWVCRACGWKGTEGQTRLLRTRRACPRCDSRRLTVTEELIPDPERKGLTFRRFVGCLRNLGYAVDYRVLNAADYGVPTHRRRLFLLARTDGEAVNWPKATHGNPAKLAATLKPWVPVASVIDWSIRCPSIFERARPLRPKTEQRIASGIFRYVLNDPKPFLVKFRYDVSGSAKSVDEPCPTITSGSGSARPAGAAHALGLVTPVVARIGQTGGNGAYANSAEAPLTTITSKAEHLLVAPVLASYNHGDWAQRPGDRTRSVEQPAAALTCSRDSPALVAAFLEKYKVDALAPTMVSGYGERAGQQPRAGSVEAPMPTAVGTSKHAVAAATLVHFNHGDKQANGVGEPLRTVTSNNHAALVYAFLTKHYSQDGQWQGAGKDRFGLVTVTVDGETYVIVDIGLRMLTPRELAKAQGFPADYIMPGSNSAQVARIGNSVCPGIARAIVAANYKPRRRAVEKQQALA